MKKLLIIAAFLFIENATFSQSKDEEAIKKVIMSVTNSNWESKNFDEFINNFAKSEHVVFGFTFKYKGYDSLQTMAKNYFINNTTPSGSKWEYSDWKIKLNGTSSFARCVETRTYPTGAKIKIHKANYLEKVGKEWKIIANLALTQQDEVAKDEAEIKNVIENLTSRAGSNDIPAYLNLLAKTDYISRVSIDSDGKTSKLTGKEYSNMVNGRASLGNLKYTTKVTRSNYLIRINGNAAFAVFDQNNEYEDGTKRDSIEERFLEKINGEWKIVNVTVIPKK
jgi:hypothetical protein